MTIATTSRIIPDLTGTGTGYLLALSRIGLGALTIWTCGRFIRDDCLWNLWIAPDAPLARSGPPWVRPLPEAWLELAWLCIGVAALFIMAGLFYRTAIVTLMALAGYFLLIGGAEYLGSFRLILVQGAVLCVLPAARVWSLDAWTTPTRDD